jgi:hypothetical protein
MRHKIKVVMLPTDANYGAIEIDSANNNKLSVEAKNYHHKNPQHLYITVSQNVELIKQDDWITDGTKLIKASSKIVSAIYLFNRRDWRKIIATTDRLIIGHELEQGNSDSYIYLPQVQHSFLKEFVANPDGEYEIEYEQYNSFRLSIDCNEVNVTCTENSLTQKLIKHLESNHIEASKRRVEVIMDFILSDESVKQFFTTLK